MGDFQVSRKVMLHLLSGWHTPRPSLVILKEQHPCSGSCCTAWSVLLLGQQKMRELWETPHCLRTQEASWVLRRLHVQWLCGRGRPTLPRSKVGRFQWVKNQPPLWESLILVSPLPLSYLALGLTRCRPHHSKCGIPYSLGTRGPVNPSEINISWECGKLLRLLHLIN